MADEPAQNTAGSGAGPPRGRPFTKGVSGNPGGRPKTIAAIEASVRQLHGPRVVEILGKMYEMALKGDVQAARLFLGRVLGPEKAASDPMPLVPISAMTEPNEVTADAVMGRLLRLISAHATSLETKAAEQGLSAEDSALLSGHVRAMAAVARGLSTFEDKYAKDAERLSDAGLEAELCHALGITVEQLRVIRAQRAIAGARGNGPAGGP